MKKFRRKKTEEDFKKFITECDYFVDKEKKSIQKTFKHRQIKTIFTLTMYLFLWSFCSAFIDTFLVTRGFLSPRVEGSMFVNFLPTLIFLCINATLKFTFIYFYLRGRIRVKIWQIFIGVIPMIGSLFIAAILLRRQKLFFKALKKYLKYRKKKRLEFLENIKLG